MFCFLCVTFYIDCTLQCMFKYVNEGLREAVASKKLESLAQMAEWWPKHFVTFFFMKKRHQISIYKQFSG